MSENLLTVLCRWLRQGRTDNQETSLDAYGKQVVYEVIRILPQSERETSVGVDLNRQHLLRLEESMWQVVGHFSNDFDQYATRLFERPIRGSWRVFVHMTKHGAPHEGPGNPWYWEDMTGDPHYPASEQMSFEYFASVFFHEVAHGWVFLMTDYEALDKWIIEHAFKPPRESQTNWRRDEEDVCWEVSRFVCKLLGIEFDEKAIP